MLSLLLTTLALPVVATPEPAPLGSGTATGYHLGSFGSVLGARFAQDGAIDSGLGVVQVIDGTTGEPLHPVEPSFGTIPRLSLSFRGQLGQLDTETLAIAPAVEASKDRRVVVSVQVKLSNPTEATVEEILGVELSAGGGDPLLRPHPSVPFAQGASFARDGSFITRDGQVVLGWVGRDPEIELNASVEDPSHLACRLAWPVAIPAGESRYVELKLAGPPAAETTDEEAWRAAFLRRNYFNLEETLRWQWQFRGRFASFQSASRGLWRAMVGGIHFLRSLGDANHVVRSLSDRPYGHPATDAAVEAEILGYLLEWGMDEISVPFLRTLVEEVGERAGPLSPARRVAYLHGLARSVRLAQDAAEALPVAEAIVELVTETAEVRPWQDPDVVRRDFVKLIEYAGLEGADELPQLQWATVDDPESIAGWMNRARRAITERDAAEAWSFYRKLLNKSVDTGMGSMVDGGELDGEYSMGMISLARALLVDDHGDDLHLLPGLAYGLISLREPVDTGWINTRFGPVKANVYHVGKTSVGGWILHRPTRQPDRMIVHLPDGVRARKVQGEATGGLVEILDDGSVEVMIEPKAPRGLTFNLRVAKT